MGNNSSTGRSPTWIPAGQWTELTKVWAFPSATLRVIHPSPGMKIQYKKFILGGNFETGEFKSPLDTFEFYGQGSLDLYTARGVNVTWGY